MAINMKKLKAQIEQREDMHLLREIMKFLLTFRHMSPLGTEHWIRTEAKKAYDDTLALQKLIVETEIKNALEDT